MPKTPKEPFDFSARFGRKYPDPLKARRNIAKAVEKRRRELTAVKRAAKAGGFFAVEPSAEKGIFLNLFKKKPDGALERVVLKKSGNPLVLQQAVDNLRKELRYYSKKLDFAKNPEIVIRDSSNVLCWVEVSETGLVKKVLVERSEIFGYSEATTYYFDRKGNFIVENVVQKI